MFIILVFTHLTLMQLISLTTQILQCFCPQLYTTQTIQSEMNKSEQESGFKLFENNAKVLRKRSYEATA